MKKKPLNNKDKKNIRGDIKASNRVGIFATFLGGLLAQGLLTTNLSVLVIEIIALFVVLIIIYLTKLSTRKKRKELLLGYKFIESHPVTEKTDYKDNEPGIGGYNHKYYVVANRNKHFVDRDFYDKVEVGDNILIHYSPVCNTELDVSRE